MSKSLPTDLLGLTEEQFKTFDSACNRTLQAIAGDLFVEDNNTMKRADVIEVVLDADYLRSYGGGFKDKDWHKEYDTIYQPWVSKHYGTPKFKKLMTHVFTFASYSL